jgi:hypothetical protein
VSVAGVGAGGGGVFEARAEARIAKRGKDMRPKLTTNKIRAVKSTTAVVRPGVPASRNQQSSGSSNRTIA